MKSLAICFFVGIFLILTDFAKCQRPSGRGSETCRGRRCHKLDHGNATSDLYAWTRTLDNNANIQETASVLPEKKIVVLYSNDSQLLDLNITKATTLFDSSQNSTLMVIKTRLRLYPCFLVETNLTYAGVTEELKKRNRTTLTVTTKRSLSALDPPLVGEEREKLFNQSTAISIQCKRRDIVKTKASAGNSNSGDTKTLKLMELDGSITLTIPAKLRNTLPRRQSGRGKGRGHANQTAH
ncbi:hypothetical protein Btru_002266 [Bulinus truncatus]|nr:hypothetical protein Btru_002266 [Bulinus truncatus]